MWYVLGKLLTTKTAVVLLAAIGAWNIYQFARPESPTLDELRMEVGEEACWAIIDSLPSDINPEQRVAVTRFVGDPTRYITGKLEELIERTGRVSLMDKSFLDRTMRELNMEEEEIGTFDQALEVGQSSGSDYVIYGNIERFVSDRTNARITMNIAMVDVAEGKLLMANVIDISPSQTEARIRSISGWSRILFWIVFAFSVPLIFVKIVKDVLSKESNTANLILVICLTVVSTLFSLVLVGFELSSFGVGVLVMLALIASATYNYWICDYMERLNN